MPEPNCLERTRNRLLKGDLLNLGDRVAVACSGGADSIFLLHVLLALRDDLALTIGVAHFNHRIRPEAEQDEDFVRTLAGSFSLPFLAEGRDVAAFARDHGMNLEEAARELRYEFLRRAASRLGANRIATGHTRTDQAETVLLRLLRGAGPRGLAGIPAAGEHGLVRPLLDVSREEIRSFLKSSGRAFRDDPSNRDRRFLRNRIRHELLPLIESEYAPGIEAGLARLADIMREEDLWGEEVARAALAKAALGSGTSASIDRDAISEWAPALQRRMIRGFFERIRGDLRNVTFEDTQAVLDLVRGREFTLRGDIRLRNEGGRIHVIPPDETAPDFSYSWDGNGVLPVPEAGLALRGEHLEGKNAERPDFDDRRMAFLDLGSLRLPLTVRRRRPGDRYRPLGSPGRRALKEIFRERGVPIRERDLRPVLVSGEEIVWVVGCPAAEACKLTGSTTEILRITVESAR